MATPDVTVMGAGVFGLSVAYACARRGARVRVIERHAVGAGSSGGPVGALAPHTPENWNSKKQFQFESLLMSEAFWGDVETISGLPTGYGRTGRLQALDTDRSVELARARCADAALLWQDRAAWEVIDAGSEWAPHSPTGLLVHDTLSARILPLGACESLAAAISALGGEIVIGSQDPSGQVVWATGHEGLRALSEDLARPVGNGVKGQALSLRLDRAHAPQLYANGLHVVPHTDGTVAIGSTSERDFVDAEATDDQLEVLLRRACSICPALVGAPVLRRWAGVRPRARSRAPMLGQWPDRPEQFIANGGFKIGFGMAPKVAEVMAALVLDGRDEIPDGFRVADSL